MNRSATGQFHRRSLGRVARGGGLAPGLLVLFVLLALCCPGIGEARSSEALFRKALVSFSMAEFEQSIQLLQQAKAVTEDPKRLSQIYLYLAANLDILERSAEAESAMAAALTYDPALKIEEERFRDSTLDLWRHGRRTMFGVLVVTANQKAIVWIDKARRGLTPLRLRLPIGAYQLELLNEDRTSRARTQAVVFFEQTTRANLHLRRMKGTLTLTSTPPGAEVIVDGRVLGKTPLVRASLDAGTQHITMRLDNAHEEKITVRIHAEKDTKILVPLKVLQVQAPRRDGPPRPPRLWTWILAGGAGVTLVTSMGLGLAALADHNSWETQISAPPPHDSESMENLKDAGQSKQLAANLLLGIGGALTVAAVVAYILERPEHKRARIPQQTTGKLTSWVAPCLNGRGAGLVWSARY